MPTLLKNVVTWLRDKLRPRFRSIVVEAEIPDNPRHKVLYIVTENRQPWNAAMVCPCGCEAILQLNLLQDEHPTWRLTHHVNHTVSLFPSVWRKIGCHSHFWFRESRVYWTPDQPSTLMRDIKLLLRKS